MPTEPTPQAMRAARAALSAFYMRVPPPADKMAEIIDRECGLRRLLAIAEVATRVKQLWDSGGMFRQELYNDLRAALEDNRDA